jgi:hypothetical protein
VSRSRQRLARASGQSRIRGSSLTAATGITALAIGISNAPTGQPDDAVPETIAASRVGIVPILRPIAGALVSTRTASETAIELS